MSPQSGLVRSSDTASQLDGLLKHLSGATVKFSNDKLIKAMGLLRDALQLYKRGDKTNQEDFKGIFDMLEQLKTDRGCLPLLQHLEAIGATIPAFAVKILPRGASIKEHLGACQESAQYYLNRILKLAKERYHQQLAASRTILMLESSNDTNSIEWVNAMNGLLTGISGDAQRLAVEEDGFVVEEEPMVKEEFPTVKKELPTTKKELPANGTKSVSDTEKSGKVQLEGNRWYIRKAMNPPEPVIISPEALNQALAIEDSKKLAVKVDAKINAVIVDLEVGDVVSSVELLGCTKVRLFLTGEAHVVVLDGCESVQVYLSKSSRNAKLVTSKCMEINVVAPAGLLDPNLSGDAADDYVELPVPVQFFTHIDSHGKLVTEPHEHVGV